MGLRDRDEVVVATGAAPAQVEILGNSDGDGWRSGKVHGPQGVMVDLDSFGQSLGVPAITLTRHVAALSTAETTETGVVER